MRYQHDAAGSVRIITDTSNSGQVLTLTYDAQDRLTRGYTSSEGDGPYDQSYTYDAIGNMTSKAGTSQWYSDTAHVHAVTYAGGQSDTYDANGNQVTSAAGTWYEYTRSWDAQNRLIGIGGDGASAAFVYDGDSNRVKATIDGVVRPPSEFAILYLISGMKRV